MPRHYMRELQENMDRELKIAFCISGETRNFGDKEFSNVHYPVFIDTLRNLGHDVDLYGHTWTHCNISQINKKEFVNFKIQDQQVIDNWIKQDLFVRHANKVPVDISNFDIEDIAKKGRAVYGQTWGFWECVNLIESIDQYDILIRYRWDLGFEKNERDIHNFNIEMFDIELHREAAGCASGESRFTSDLRFPNKCDSVVRGTIDDVVMIFNSNAFRKMHKSYDRYEDISTVLHHIAQNERRGLPIVEAHALWYTVLINQLHIEIATTIPSIFKLTRH